MPYSALYYLDRGLDYPQIGLLLSSGGLLALFGGPAWGSLSDRLSGSGRVLLAAAFVSVLGVSALAFAADFGTILAANVVMAFGNAGILPILDARALAASGSDRATWGPVRAWGSFGWVVTSLVVGVVAQRVGLGVIFVGNAVGIATAAWLVHGLAPGASVRAERPLRQALQLFRRRSILLFLLGAMLANAAMSAGLDFFTARFDELGAAAALIGFAWALPAAIEVPTMATFPRLARRFGGTRLLVLGAIVLALRTGLAALATEPTLLAIASGLGGIGYGLFTIGGVTYVASHVPPELAATGQGIFQGVSLGLSGVIAAAVAGVLAGGLGIAGMLAIAAAVGLGAAVIIAIAVLPSGDRGEPRPQGSAATLGA
jgi:MFS transporter, PPP family, 3-phenylpropionic acid transporter